MDIFESVAMRNAIALVVLVFVVLTVAVAVSVLFLRKPESQYSESDDSKDDINSLKISATKEDKL